MTKQADRKKPPKMRHFHGVLADQIRSRHELHGSRVGTGNLLWPDDPLPRAATLGNRVYDIACGQGRRLNVGREAWRVSYDVMSKQLASMDDGSTYSGPAVERGLEVAEQTVPQISDNAALANSNINVPPKVEVSQELQHTS